jgi:hypothetical protein
MNKDSRTAQDLLLEWGSSGDPRPNQVGKVMIDYSTGNYLGAMGMSMGGWKAASDEPDEDPIHYKALSDMSSKSRSFDGRNGKIDRVGFEDGSEISVNRDGKLCVGREKFYGNVKDLVAYKVLQDYASDQNLKLLAGKEFAGSCSYKLSR